MHNILSSFRFTALLLLWMGVTLSADAYDFKYQNYCFNILDAAGRTCELTYPDDSEVVYSGDIPGTVSYNGVTYTVTRIGSSAFKRQPVGTVYIPGTVTSIGREAFYFCTDLNVLTIPSSVQTIESYAFAGCIILPSISIPSSVTSIGVYAFDNCRALTTANIPSSITRLDAGVFFGCGLESITIPNSIQYIASSAFAYCDRLTSVYIPASVIDMTDAFHYCGGLEMISVNPANPSYSSQDGVLYNKDKSILLRVPANTPLTTLTIPSSVEYIETEAMQKCMKLNTVILPQALEKICPRTFYGCLNLSSVEIPASVTSIGDEAFLGCENLQTISLPKSLITLDNKAFAQSGLTSDDLPASLGYIGEGAFDFCENLESIWSPTAKPAWCGGSLFTNTETKVYIPDGAEAYYKQVGWPEDITYLGMKVDAYSFRIITQEGYATYYNEFPYRMPEGVSGMIVGNATADGELTLIERYCSGSIVPAKTPLLLKGEPGQRYHYYLEPGNEEEPAVDNLLCGSLEPETPINDDSFFYMLSYDGTGENLGFYWGNANGEPFENGSQKAYLKLPTWMAQGVKGFVVNDHDVTGLTGTTAEKVREEVIYNLNGVRVKSATRKGFYIVNGKKVIVR